MKKHRLLPVLLLIFSLSLTACSSRGGNTAASSPQGAGPAPSAMPSSAPAAPAEKGDYYGIAANQSSFTEAETAIGGQESKLILRADLQVESTEFDQAVETLHQLVQNKGGYFEHNALQRGTYYDTSAARYGDFVIRVPKENYHAFLSAAGTVGHVVSSSETSEDVGEVYYDTEIRLKTQRTKYERLLSLLEKADNMENIIALESSLSEVEYEIERLSGTLRKYDSLVGYSTINLRLNEVLSITEHPREVVSLSGRISNAFSGGLSSLGRRASNFLVWAAYNFVGIIFFMAICAVTVVIVVKRRRKPRVKGPHIPSQDKE